jgi:hypothetical protein
MGSFSKIVNNNNNNKHMRVYKRRNRSSTQDTNGRTTLLRDELIQKEFYEQVYVQQLIPCMQEEKDYMHAYFLCLTLAKHLPHAKRIWLYWLICNEKLEMMANAVRCLVIGLHVHPTHEATIRHGIQLLVKSGEGKMADELRIRQYALNPLDFDLCYHYFRQMIYKNMYHDAFVFILNYFLKRYCLIDSNNVLQLQENRRLQVKRIREFNTKELQQFRTVAQQFVSVEQYSYAVQVYQLASILTPEQSTFYYSLYEIYQKLGAYLDAFKAYALFIYTLSIGGAGTGDIDVDLSDANVFSNMLTMGNIGTIEQYQKCGELLEKSGYYSHAFLAYYQCHILHLEQLEQESMQEEKETSNIDIEGESNKKEAKSDNALLREYDNLEQIDQADRKLLEKKYRYLIYIRNNILNKLLNQDREYEIALSKHAKDLIEQIINNMSQIDQISLLQQ